MAAIICQKICLLLPTLTMDPCYQRSGQSHVEGCNPTPTLVSQCCTCYHRAAEEKNNEFEENSQTVFSNWHTPFSTATNERKKLKSWKAMKKSNSFLMTSRDLLGWQTVLILAVAVFAIASFSMFFVMIYSVVHGVSNLQSRHNQNKAKSWWIGAAIRNFPTQPMIQKSHSLFHLLQRTWIKHTTIPQRHNALQISNSGNLWCWQEAPEWNHKKSVVFCSRSW